MLDVLFVALFQTMAGDPAQGDVSCAVTSAEQNDPYWTCTVDGTPPRLCRVSGWRTESIGLWCPSVTPSRWTSAQPSSDAAEQRQIAPLSCSPVGDNRPTDRTTPMACVRDEQAIGCNVYRHDDGVRIGCPDARLAENRSRAAQAEFERTLDVIRHH